MPSLREKVTTYFRQLSFIADPRETGRHLSSLSPRKTNDDNFITKYLEGRLDNIFSPGPDVKNGQTPKELPDIPLNYYPTGPSSITAACTGPDEGLTGVKRSKLHLSAGSDIDFIDTNLDQEIEIRRSISNQKYRFNANAQKFRPDQNANKAITRSRKNSRVGDIAAEKSDTNIIDNSTTYIVSMVSSKPISPEDIKSKTAIVDKQVCVEKSDALASIKVTELIDKENVSPHDRRENHPTEKNLNQLPHLNTNSVLAHNEPVAGVKNWNLENDHAYGISVSLYERNFLTNEQMGNPVADCYGLVVRGNSAVMSLADGVNWGEGARLAARSAVQGSLEYLDTAIFGSPQGCMATSTKEVFVSLLRSFWEAQSCILDVGGALSTLTVAIVLPLAEPNLGKYVVCSCNVGDSLGYIYSKKHGVREFTQGSHDITSMRDMRDALGALGPVDGNKPELSNLTLSMTVVDPGDIVFLTSDGISDNFDPVVGKFAEAFMTVNQTKRTEYQLAPKRYNKSASAIYSRSTVDTTKTRSPSNDSDHKILASSSSSSSSTAPVRPPRTKKLQSPSSQSKSTTVPSRPKYMRSHTVIEPRISLHKSPIIKFPKSPAGLPLVSGSQRHTLTLLRLEDLLSYGINGTLRPCPSARKLCHLLVDFAKMITSARRKTLEQRELFYKIITGQGGIKEEVELTRIQHRAGRKRVVDGSTFQSLPGKLDHASVVAFTVGSGLQPTEFYETNF